MFLVGDLPYFEPPDSKVFLVSGRLKIIVYWQYCTLNRFNEVQVAISVFILIRNLSKQWFEVQEVILAAILDFGSGPKPIPAEVFFRAITVQNLNVKISFDSKDWPHLFGSETPILGCFSRLDPTFPNSSVRP